MALTDLAIRHAGPPGKAYSLSDRHGLYIQVKPSGSKLWYLKFRFGNKENRVALGPYPLISLALAREKQADIRRLILEGVNPAEKCREEKRGGEPLYFAVAGFVALRRWKGQLAESAGKAARRIQWSQQNGREEVDREWQIAVQGMEDKVGGPQRDVVLPDDFSGLAQRQPLLADFVSGHGVFLFVL